MHVHDKAVWMSGMLQFSYTSNKDFACLLKHGTTGKLPMQTDPKLLAQCNHMSCRLILPRLYAVKVSEAAPTAPSKLPDWLPDLQLAGKPSSEAAHAYHAAMASLFSLFHHSLPCNFGLPVVLAHIAV